MSKCDGPLILYHANCQDGWASAWAFHLAFPDAEFIPVQHGSPPPDMANRTVFILDFSYPKDVLLHLAMSATSITILDHHQSAQRDLESLPPVGWPPPPGLSATFDMEKSGAVLAWRYVMATSRTIYPMPHLVNGVPWLLRLVQARDLWTWDVKDARSLDAGLASHPRTFLTWDEIATWLPGGYDHAHLARDGDAILRAQGYIIDSLVKNAWETRIAGHTVPVINTGTYISETVGRLAVGKPFAAGYFDRSDGMRVYSLRSAPNGIDVSKVAQVFGGGGHARAAGFQMPQGIAIDEMRKP